MSAPVIAQKGPYPVELTAGQTVYWCACGRSSSQPFCDGSHRVTDFTPKPYTAVKDGTVWFCGCKHSGTPQTCDGTHRTL
ncbi:MAG: CDGSH iron-sulfur domain-containing protein [Ancalomicrobiaceae bacterium]|nr:CDGSH iron-sulfur domain-containing protein [Ancalomicrobiaceae bacterium]